MDNIKRLEEIFTKFPGIGPRQARRFVYHILSRPVSYINDFANLILDARKQSLECVSCRRLYISNRINGQKDLCNVCSDLSRDRNTLLIVARDSDFEAVEKSGAYRGVYFVLGGTIPILDKEPERRIRLELLLTKIADSNEIEEIILSLNTTPEGDNTADIIKDAIKKINLPKKVKLSILGRGLSTGAELEYVDGETIKNALKNRSSSSVNQS